MLGWATLAPAIGLAVSLSPWRRCQRVVLDDPASTDSQAPSSWPAGSTRHDHLPFGGAGPCGIEHLEAGDRVPEVDRGRSIPPDGAREAGVEGAPVPSLRGHGDGDAAAVNSAPPALGDRAPRGSLRLGRPSGCQQRGLAVVVGNDQGGSSAVDPETRADVTLPRPVAR